MQRVGVQDYQTVKAGQSIVELDHSDYQASVDEARAAISAARAELSANQDAKRAADANIEAAKASVEQAQAAADAAEAGIDAAQAQVTQSTSEYKRQETLLRHAELRPANSSSRFWKPGIRLRLPCKAATICSAPRRQ